MNLVQLGRFAIVGSVQNAVNLGTFASLNAGGAGYGVSAVVAALAGLAVSFVMNRRWTFACAPGGGVGHLLRFCIVFATAVLAGVVLLTIQVELLGFAAVPAQALAILIVGPASFIGQREWVFRTDLVRHERSRI